MLIIWQRTKERRELEVEKLIREKEGTGVEWMSVMTTGNEEQLSQSECPGQESNFSPQDRIPPNRPETDDHDLEGERPIICGEYTQENPRRG